MNIPDSHSIHEFQIGGEQFAIALVYQDKVKWPEAVTPTLYVETGGNTEKLIAYDTLWDDLKEELGEEYIANSIVSRFGKELEKRGGTAMTFNQKLAAIFQLRLAVVNGKLILRPQED